MIILYLGSKLSTLEIPLLTAVCGEPFGAGCTGIKMDCLGCKLLWTPRCIAGKSITIAVRRGSIQRLPESCNPRPRLLSLVGFLMLLWISLLLSSLLLTAMGKPRRWSGGGNQRCAEWPFGSKRRLPLSRQDRSEPGPDESQCHQWNHEHRAPLHQAPQGHLRGTWELWHWGTAAGRGMGYWELRTGFVCEWWGKKMQCVWVLCLIEEQRLSISIDTSENFLLDLIITSSLY